MPYVDEAEYTQFQAWRSGGRGGAPVLSDARQSALSNISGPALTAQLPVSSLRGTTTVPTMTATQLGGLQATALPPGMGEDLVRGAADDQAPLLSAYRGAFGTQPQGAASAQPPAETRRKETEEETRIRRPRAQTGTLLGQ